MSSTPFVIAVLGNPGEKYEYTRHNAAWLVLEMVFKYYSIIPERKLEKKRNAMIWSTTRDCHLTKRNNNQKEEWVEKEKPKKLHPVIFVKPLSFMNLSGEVIQPILAYYKLTSSQLLVLTDDLDQKLGDFKRKPSWGAGGQNGLKNIILKLGTDNFSRIKIGIGRPDDKNYDITNRVLSKFSASDLQALEKLVPALTHQIGLFLEGKK